VKKSKNDKNETAEIKEITETTENKEMSVAEKAASEVDVTSEPADELEVAEEAAPEDNSREEVNITLDSDGTETAGKTPSKSSGLMLVILGVIVVLLAVAASIFHNVGGKDSIISPLSIHGKKISSADFSFMYHYTMIEEGVDLFAADTPNLLSSPYMDDEKYSTYRDYFLDYTAQRLQSIEILYDDAVSKGLDIENRHFERAEAYISWLKSQADTLGVSLDTYIKGVYGNQVSEQTALNFLAKMYFTDDYGDGAKLEELSATDQQAEEAYENDKNTYDFVDYKILRIAYEQREQAYVETANLHAQQIIDEMADDPSKFESCAAKYFSGAAKATLEQPDSTLVSNCRDGDFTHSDFRNWLFGVDRRPGDATIFTDSDGFPVILVFVQRQKLSIHLRDVHIAHIYSVKDESGNTNISQAQSLAQEIYETVTDADSFSEIENKYNSEVLEGRLVVTHSQMTYPEQYSEEFSSWIFDGNRTPGNKTIFEMDGDFYVLYFASESPNPEWYDRVNSFVRMNNYRAFLDEKCAEYTYEFDENGLTSIRDVP